MCAKSSGEAGKFSRIESKIKMTTQSAKLLTFALSFCTFIFAL
jgi:hypothetical protein